MLYRTSIRQNKAVRPQVFFPLKSDQKPCGRMVFSFAIPAGTFLSVDRMCFLAFSLTVVQTEDSFPPVRVLPGSNREDVLGMLNGLSSDDRLWVLAKISAKDLVMLLCWFSYGLLALPYDVI